MNYQKIYDSIVQKAKSENRVKHFGYYYENHHIIPRCLGGSDSKDNLVLLTAREHFICHKLLVEFHPNNKSLINTLWMISTMKNSLGREFKVSSREFEKIRIKFLSTRVGVKRSEETVQKLRQSCIDNPRMGMKGRHHSEETRLKLSKSHLGIKRSPESVAKQRVSLLGRHVSNETRIKISNSNKGQKRSEETKSRIKLSKLNYKCKPFTEEHKRNISKGLTGVKFSESHRNNLSLSKLNELKKLCPYCGISIRGNVINRWHFENCRFKINEGKKE